MAGHTEDVVDKPKYVRFRDVCGVSVLLEVLQAAAEDGDWERRVG